MSTQKYNPHSAQDEMQQLATMAFVSQLKFSVKKCFNEARKTSQIVVNVTEPTMELLEYAGIVALSIDTKEALKGVDTAVIAKYVVDTYYVNHPELLRDSQSFIQEIQLMQQAVLSVQLKSGIDNCVFDQAFLKNLDTVADRMEGDEKIKYKSKSLNHVLQAIQLAPAVKATVAITISSELQQLINCMVGKGNEKTAQQQKFFTEGKRTGRFTEEELKALYGTLLQTAPIIMAVPHAFFRAISTVKKDDIKGILDAAKGVAIRAHQSLEDFLNSDFGNATYADKPKSLSTYQRANDKAKTSVQEITLQEWAKYGQELSQAWNSGQVIITPLPFSAISNNNNAATQPEEKLTKEETAEVKPLLKTRSFAFSKGSGVPKPRSHANTISNTTHSGQNDGSNITLSSKSWTTGKKELLQQRPRSFVITDYTSNTPITNYTTRILEESEKQSQTDKESELIKK